VTTTEDTRPATPPGGRPGYSWDPLHEIEWEEGTAHPGLFVACYAPTIGEYLQYVIEPNSIEEKDGVWATREQRFFASYLVDWNVRTRAGEPVPPSLAGLASLKRPLADAIIARWLDETSRVAVPLDGRSTSGSTSQLERLPMEPPSPD